MRRASSTCDGRSRTESTLAGCGGQRSAAQSRNSSPAQRQATTGLVSHPTAAPSSSSPTAPASPRPGSSRSAAASRARSQTSPVASPRRSGRPTGRSSFCWPHRARSDSSSATPTTPRRGKSAITPGASTAWGSGTSSRASGSRISTNPTQPASRRRATTWTGPPGHPTASTSPSWPTEARTLAWRRSTQFGPCQRPEESRRKSPGSRVASSASPGRQATRLRLSGSTDRAFPDGPIWRSM